MNTYTAVRYALEILAGASTEKVVVDRAALKALVRAAKSAPGYALAKRIAQQPGSPAAEKLHAAR